MHGRGGLFKGTLVVLFVHLQTQRPFFQIHIIRHCRIRIAYFCEVGQTRLGQKEFQDSVVALLRLQFRYAALGIIDVSENDGSGRTGLGASGGERIGRDDDVNRGGGFNFLSNLGLFDALDAERAFFHDATHADCDVWILAHLEQIPFVLFTMPQGSPIKVRTGAAFVIIKEVKATDFIRTIIGAITRSDTAIIDHQIKAFLVVDGGIDRTNVFARSRFAVLAHHWLSDDLRVINPGLELLFVIRIEGLKEILFFGAGGIVAVYPEPVHFAAAPDLILTNDRDVVLTLASHDTSSAADTKV